MTRARPLLLAVLATLALAGCVGPDLYARSGRLLPATTGAGWGYIDELGLVRISFHFTDAGPFSEGLAPIALGKPFGYLDEQGTIVIPPRYEAAGAFKEGRAPVSRNGTWTFITTEGKEITAVPLSGASAFHEGMAKVRNPELKWGYVDLTGSVVIPPVYDWAEDFSEGLGCVLRDKKTSYVDASGRPVPTLGSWAHAGRFSEGLAAVEKDGRWGFINRTGAFVIEPRFERAQEFAEGLAPVELQGKFGYIDRTGQMVLEPRFPWAWPFSEGLARVTDVRGKCGYIDKSGRELIRPQFDEAEAFSQGFAKVRIDDQWSYIRPNGLLVWSRLEYQDWDLIEEISLEREPGLVSTERTVVSFRSDGTARYRSIGGGKPSGDFEGTLERESFERLAKLIQSQGFFEMKDWYPVRVDHPTAKLRVTRGGKTKSVEADNAGGPTAWWGMVAAVDGLRSSVDWKKK
jgi:hypothetical protein